MTIAEARKVAKRLFGKHGDAELRRKGQIDEDRPRCYVGYLAMPAGAIFMIEGQGTTWEKAIAHARKRKRERGGR